MKCITKERFSFIDVLFISIASIALHDGHALAYFAVLGIHLVFLLCQSFWGVRGQT